MDPQGRKEVGSSDDEGSIAEASSPAKSEGDYSEQDASDYDEDVEPLEDEEEDDDVEERYSARAQPPSRSRSPIEIEVLSSDEDDVVVPSHPQSQTIPVSSSPIASQRTDDDRQSEEEEEEEAEEEEDDVEMHYESVEEEMEDSEAGGEQQSDDDEPALQISEQDVNPSRKSDEEEEEAEQEDSNKISYEFSKPFEPKEPLNIPMMDPLTQDLMDSVEELKVLPDDVLSRLTNLWAAKNRDMRALQDQLSASGNLRLEDVDLGNLDSSSVEQTLESLNEALVKKHKETRILQIQRDSARSREEETIRQLRRKDEEVQRIVTENTALSSQLSQAITNKCDALLKLQNIEGKEIQIQNKEWRMDNENASLKANCSHLTEKLDSTTRELTQLKHITALKITDLEINLRDSKAEVSSFEGQISSLKESLSQQERRVESLQEALRESRDSAIGLQEAHTLHVQAKTHEAKLFQEQSAEADKVATSYLAAIDELRNTLKDATEKYGDLETRLETDKVNFDREIEQKNKLISNLRSELANANELLQKYTDVEMQEQISAMAPSASSARSMIQSNLSFTEIFNMYKTKEEELSLLAAENVHLRESMKNVLFELEESAPKQAKESETLNSTMIENERLISDFDRMAHELEIAQDEAQQARRNAGLMKRDKERMQTQIDDLSRQITVLLREIDALNLRRPSFRPHYGHSLDALGAMSPSDVVTERLLPFRDIEELQSRNMELVAAVRELTKQAEEASLAKESGIDIVKMSDQLEIAFEDLKCLQEKEKQHTALIDQLTEQRNHFRDISSQGRSLQDVGVSPMKFDASPMRRSIPPTPSFEEKEIRKKLMEAKETVARTVKQTDELIREKREIEDKLTKEIEKLSKGAEEKGVMVSKLKAVLENREGKLATAQIKVQELTKQVEVFEAKCKSQAEHLTSETRKRQELLGELHKTRSSLDRAEVAVNRLRSELDSARTTQESLKNQCDSWKKSAEEKSSIQASVEQMRVALEKSRKDGTEKFIRQLDESRLEAASLRTRLQEETKRLGDELVQLHSALEAERDNVRSAQDNIVAAKNETAIVEERLAQSHRDVQALRAHRNPSVDSSIQTEVFVTEEVAREKRMAQRASEFEVVITSLRSELEMAKSRAVEYKNIADATERSLVKWRKESETSDQKLKESKKLWEAEEQSLKNMISNLQKELAETSAKVQTASAEATQQLEIVQRQLAECEAQKLRLQQVVDEGQVTKSALNAAEEEVHRLGERLANETELNMKNMQVNMDLKTQVAAAVAERAALIEGIEQNKRLVDQLETDLEEKESQLEEATSGHTQEVQQKQAHIDTLYNQMKTMQAEICALKETNSNRENLFGEGSSLLNISNISTDENQTSPSMMQLVSFLRKEKQALGLQVEELKTKLAEAKAKLEVAEQQLEDQTRLAGPDAPEGPELVTRTRYEALVRRLETMNALSESARLQREECASLRKQNEVLQEKIKVLLEEASVAQAQTRRFEEKAGALQVELALVKGEASRWRTCANQLTEKANQANPEELKRLLQERENLTKQLQAERDTLSKEREEVRKLRLSTTEKDQQLTTLKNESTQIKADLIKMTEEHTKISASHKEMSEKHKDLVSKELTVRRIAKKYKTQFDTLVAEVKQKDDAAKVSAGLAESEQVKEAEARLAEVEAREAEQVAKVQELEDKINAVNEQVITKESEFDKLQSDMASLKEREEKLKTMLHIVKGTLSEKNKLLEEAKSRNTALNDEVQKSLQQNEEIKVRNAALQSQFEARQARMEKELQELRPLVEAYRALQQPISQAEQQQHHQVEELTQPPVQQDSQQHAMRTANVPPFAARGRGQGQAAAVTPTSRVGTPMALLRPMKATTGQLQAPSSSSVLPTNPSQEPSTSRPQKTLVRATVRTEVQPPLEPTTTQELQEEVASPTVNVLLVRPHEVHPAVSSSQTPAVSAPPPTTTSAQPSSSSQIGLKRTRDAEVTSLNPEAPSFKQSRMEVSSATAEVEVEEEPSSTLRSIAESEEIALVDCEEEELEDAVEGDQEDEVMEEEDEEEEDEEGNDQEAEENLEDDENDDNEGEGGAQDFAEDIDQADDPNADEDLLRGEDQALNPELEQQIDDENNEENDVLILEEEEDFSQMPQDLEADSLDQQNSNEPQPSSSSLQAEPAQPPISRPPVSHSASLSLQPHQQQSLEEVGDFGIVPSTPTLFARQNVFSEAATSASQVPQRPVVMMTDRLPDSYETQAGAEGQGLRQEFAEDSNSGRSVPSTPLMASPQDLVPPTQVVELDESVEIIEEDVSDPSDFGEMPSSSSTVPSIMITPASDASSFVPAQYGMESHSMMSIPRGNRARRSGGNFGPARGRDTGRPTPITWSSPEEQQQQPQQFSLPRGRLRGAPLRRGRPNPRGDPFQPHDFQ